MVPEHQPPSKHQIAAAIDWHLLLPSQFLSCTSTVICGSVSQCKVVDMEQAKQVVEFFEVRRSIPTYQA
jgi:hypothetical protein